MNVLADTVFFYEELFRTYPLLLPLLSGVLGLVIGSFLNVVALRIPKKESFVYPPSHCVRCSHRLGPLDLIPVFSYVSLGGKCRYCKAPISRIYPFGESVTALFFAITAWHIGPRPELLVGLFLVAILSAVTLTDLKYMLIPDRILLFAAAVGGILRLFIHELPLWNYLLAALIGGGILYAIAWLSEFLLKKEGMGGGDIKLFAFLGLLLGIERTLLTIFVASLFGLLGGLMLLKSSGQGRDVHIPFGPFISLGAVCCYLWGEVWIDAYLNLFMLN